MQEATAADNTVPASWCPSHGISECPHVPDGQPDPCAVMKRPSEWKATDSMEDCDDDGFTVFNKKKSKMFDATSSSAD